MSPKESGAATKKALVPIFSSTLGTKSISKLDDKNCLSFLAGVNSVYAGRLDGYLDYLIGNCTEK